VEPIQATHRYGGYYFRLYKIRRKWLAVVHTDGNWKSVVDVNGGVIATPTRKLLIDYLRYAYEGKQ